MKKGGFFGGGGKKIKKGKDNARRGENIYREREKNQITVICPAFCSKLLIGSGKFLKLT